MVTETNIDDQSAEITAWVVDQLFAVGALDVFLTSILMKKGRPGTKITVLSSAERQGQIAQLLVTTNHYIWCSYLSGQPSETNPRFYTGDHALGACYG